MTPIPLDKIGLRWRDHKSALWWLGLIYRRRVQFQDALKGWSRWQAVKSGVTLYLHAVIYLVLICIAGRLIIFGWLEIPTKETFESTVVILQYHIFQITGGIAGGIVFGIAVGTAGGTAVGIAVGIASEFNRGIAAGIASRIAGGIAIGIAGGIVIGITGGIADEIAVGIASGIAVGIPADILFVVMFALTVGIAGGKITVGTAGGIPFVIAFIICLFRAHYYPFYWWLVWPKPRGCLYPYHPVAWDDLCIVPFPRLDQLLVAYAEYAPEAGKQEIERLIQSYPTQRQAALKAQTILLARQTAYERNLTKLAALLTPLSEGERKAFLRKRIACAKWWVKLPEYKCG